MELDPFLALDHAHVPMTPPPAPAPAPSTMDHGTDDTAPSSSSLAPNDAGVDPLAAILDEPVPSSPSRQDASSSASPPQPQPQPHPHSTPESTAPPSSTTSTGTATANPNPPPPRDLPTSHEDFQEELATLLLTNALPQSSITALQNLLRENATLKEKNAKLKSLLGRSAKAQRDAKNELESMKKAYEASRAEVERLEKRVEVLANRPTHMDLLADFETNFDRALLSIGGGSGKGGKLQQAGGEDPDSRDFASAEEEGFYGDGFGDNDDDGGNSRRSGQFGNNNHNHNFKNNSNNPSSRKTSDSLLTAELNEANARISHLESLHSSLHQRHTHLEQTHSSLLSDHQHLKSTLTNLQLELRMSKMETEHALRDVRDREASLREMQLEIDLVTASAAEANRRAAEGMEVARVARTDKEYVDGLEAKVTALQEWALASTESKRLTVERCRELEGRVKELEGERLRLLGDLERRGVHDGELELELSGGGGLGEGRVVPSIKRTNSSKSLVSNADNERVLWSKSSSLVVGAGMVGHAFLELGQVHIEPYETVILRWKFDLTPADLDIYFSVLKGICEDKKKQRAADACFRSRHVQGGGGGDVSGAFAIQNACTLVWSNEMSWVRPRTIKWTVEAVAIEWSD